MHFWENIIREATLNLYSKYIRKRIHDNNIKEATL